LLLKAWLYGYLNNLRSPRQLERACRDNVGLIWLLGRFWRRHRGGIRGVFRQVVRIARQAQVVGVVLHAVDGTKNQSRASTRRSKRWSMWGLAGVHAQWAMLCTTHNLKKLLRLWQEGEFQFSSC
jgi:transposase